MGIGDNLIATGLARGAMQRGKQIAFGDGQRIIWDSNSELIFRGNPNIAPRNHRDLKRVEWVHFYKGHRIYNKQGPDDRWIWNYDFKPIPGEVFLSRDEVKFGERVGRGYVIIEPNVPTFKTVAPNKQWPVDRYNEVARLLRLDGHKVIQFRHQQGHRIPLADQITTPNFRMALAVMKDAALYVGPEGGLHHAAAVFRRPAVVLFGGFVPPQVTGYDFHTNLTGGAEACGRYKPCEHCRIAMDRIGVDEVFQAAQSQLRKAAA